MKHIKTFESYANSIGEGLTAMKMKKVIEAVAQSLAGQLSDEGMEPDEVQGFLEENPTAAESTLEGMEEEYGVDLVSMWPKMKDDVINKVKEAMAELESVKSTKGADVNESALNEAEIYIANDKFKDEAALKADIADNIAPAFNRLLSKNGIDFPPVTIKENRGSYQIESKPITGKALGIMQYGFKEVYIDSFGGGSLPKISKDAAGFEFTPIIWFNLHYSYNHGSADTSSQGSNGCALFLPGEKTSNIWYDIVNGEFLKDSERQKFFDKNKY